MSRTERFPGWTFPDPGTTDWNDAQQLAQSAFPCPHCGALVPVAYGQYHVDFHNAPWKIGFTPRPAPTYTPPPAPTDPSIQTARATTTEGGTTSSA